MPSHIQTILVFRPFFDFLLMFFLLSGTLFGVFKTVRLFLQRLQFCSSLPCDDGCEMESYGLLFLAMLLPGITLALLEMLFTRPFLGSMYIMYGIVCIYIFLALALKRIPFRILRIGIFAVIILLYFFQLTLLLPEVSRTNYRDAADHIEKNASAGDMVMAFQWLAPENSLGYYLKDSMQPVRRITTHQGACDAAHSFFLSQEPNKRTSHAVWYALPMYIFQMVDGHKKAMEPLLSGLQERGLTCAQHYFPGHWNLNLLEIRMAGHELPEPPFTPIRMTFHFDEALMLEDLHLCYENESEKARDLYLLGRHVFSWPPIGSFIPMMDSLDLITAGEPALALAMANYTTSIHPSSP